MVESTFVARELGQFIQGILEEQRYDLIIPIERKGTALVRALLELQLIQTSWRAIISDHGIDALYRDDLADRRILIIDDTVYQAKSIKKVVDVLQAKSVARDQITTAAFVVHEACPRRPDRFYFSEVSDEKYKELRDKIIQFLQKSGSLLLDTEHIEVIAQIHCSPKELFNVLSCCGTSIEFLSSDGRLNLTIFEPFIHQKYEAQLMCEFPKDTLFGKVIKKCRIVQRTSDKFAIIPIYYPSIPESTISFGGTSIIKEYDKLSPVMRFYCGALQAGLEVLRTIIAFIETLGNKVTLYLPRFDPDGNLGGSLNHLRAFCPSFSDSDMMQLEQRIRDVVDDAKRNASKITKAAPRSSTCLSLNEETLNNLGRRLLIAIWEIMEFAGMERGVLIEEIWAECREDKSHISAAMDKLIDESWILTDVEPAEYQDGIRRVVRTFRPDGEIVTSQISKLVAMSPELRQF